MILFRFCLVGCLRLVLWFGMMLDGEQGFWRSYVSSGGVRILPKENDVDGAVFISANMLS